MITEGKPEDRGDCPFDDEIAWEAAENIGLVGNTHRERVREAIAHHHHVHYETEDLPF